MLLLCTFSFIGCDDDEEQLKELTPQEAYLTSWRGTASCEVWEQVERGVGIQFIDETNASISWNNSEEPLKNIL